MEDEDWLQRTNSTKCEVDTGVSDSSAALRQQLSTGLSPLGRIEMYAAKPPPYEEIDNPMLTKPTRKEDLNTDKPPPYEENDPVMKALNKMAKQLISFESETIPGKSINDMFFMLQYYGYDVEKLIEAVFKEKQKMDNEKQSGRMKKIYDVNRKTVSDNVLRIRFADRLTAVERSVTETRNVANETQQHQQTLSERMERIEQDVQDRLADIQMKKHIPDQTHQLQQIMSERMERIEQEVIERSIDIQMTRQMTNHSHLLQHTMSERMKRIEQDLRERQDGIQVTTNLALQTHRLQQAMSERMERIEHHLQERQPQFQLHEDERTEGRTTPAGCHLCNCKRQCSCKCHLYNLNEKWKIDRRVERRQGESDQCVQSRRVERNLDSDISVNFLNNSHDVSDPDHETLKSDQKNEKDSKLMDIEETESEIGVYGACGGDPGGPPSNDSSSDDDSSDRRKDRDYRTGHNVKGNRNKQWIIDVDAWTICIEHDGDFDAQAAALLEERKLPNQALLNEVCSKYTLSSQILKDICMYICRFIKEKSELIVHVWAAYPYKKDDKADRNEIVFVVLISDTDNVDVRDFSTYQRCILEVNTKKENKEINAKELHNRPSPEEIQNLEKCLRENARSLMEAHSKLTRVTASWFRAGVNDLTGQYSLQKELCIALYVHVKGYVPLNEKPFPTTVGNYSVDVREGLFTLCDGPDEYHTNVKMGCAISGERQGTLGAFVEFENNGKLYGVTCAHVVFDDVKLKGILEGEPIQGQQIVYQPIFNPKNDSGGHPFGTVVAALYEKGDNGTPGIEIALIEISQDRCPTEGTFPDYPVYARTDTGQVKPFVFCSGTFLDSTNRLVSPIVYKYGYQSKLTQGELRINGASVRTRVFRCTIPDTELVMHDHQDTELVLHDQMEIQSSETCPFAENGDSGALVFTDELSQGDLSAVGILEGKMKDEHVIAVTPIYAVMDALQRNANRRCALKAFQPYQTRSDYPRLGAALSEKVSWLSINAFDLKGKLEKIDQGFAQDLEAHKKEITDELQKQSEEHKKQMQEIKEQQAKQSEEIKEQQNKQSEEIKEHQNKQSEEIKEQQTKQSKEIKDLILDLLKRQNTS